MASTEERKSEVERLRNNSSDNLCLNPCVFCPPADKVIISMGIEGSANKIGVGIFKSDEGILSNVRKTFNPPTGDGFLPRETAQHHRESIISLISEALEKAKFKNIKNIDIICYTKGPGMGGPLSVGAIVSRMISLLFNIPIVGVNHCVAHVEMGRYVTGAKNPIILYVSGGNTQIISYSHHRYRIFGETLDIALGNCLDRIARMLKLPNTPSPGYQVEQFAKIYENEMKKKREKNKDGKTYNDDNNSDNKLFNKNKNVNAESELYDLPYVIKGMDMSFSGITTYVENLLNAHVFPSPSPQNNDQNHLNTKSNICQNQTKENLSSSSHPVDSSCSCGSFDCSFLSPSCQPLKFPWMVYKICYSVQEVCFAMLVEATERGLTQIQSSNEILIVGGVGCNERLQEMMRNMCEERSLLTKTTLGVMDERYCIDNGGMIAYTGLLQYLHRHKLKHLKAMLSPSLSSSVSSVDISSNKKRKVDKIKMKQNLEGDTDKKIKDNSINNHHNCEVRHVKNDAKLNTSNNEQEKNKKEEKKEEEEEEKKKEEEEEEEKKEEKEEEEEMKEEEEEEEEMKEEEEEEEEMKEEEEEEEEMKEEEEEEEGMKEEEEDEEEEQEEEMKEKEEEEEEEEMKEEEEEEEEEEEKEEKKEEEEEEEEKKEEKEEEEEEEEDEEDENVVEKSTFSQRYRTDDVIITWRE